MNLQPYTPTRFIPAIPANDLTTAEQERIEERMKRLAREFAAIERLRKSGGL